MKMFGSQKSFLSSSIEGHNNIERQEAQNSFLREWEKRIDKSDTKIIKSVEDFAKNLWSHLTDQLTKNFEEHKKDPKYSWLTDSDIWLHSLEKLYRNNQDKMPWQLEWYLKKMMELLIEYKNDKWTIKSLAYVMKSQSEIEMIGDTTASLKDLPRNFRPTDGVTPLNA